MTDVVESPRTSPPRPRPLRDLGAAIGFLTLLPIGRAWPDGETPRSTGWYPWVGWLLGGAAALAVLGAAAAKGHWPQGGAILVGALVVGGWAVLTRFLHWDGLADTADGLWGGESAERRLEIMRDSRIGSFGAAAMLFIAIVQVAAVADMVSAGVVWPIAIAPVLGRMAVAVAAWDMPAARAEGLGLTAMGVSSVYERGVAALALLAILGLAFAGIATRSLLIATAGGVFAALVVPRRLAKPVGGMTGDLFGATVLIVETVVLVTGAVLA
jgi:adenosylcobinamide-GDP ribazoletransferase